MRRFIALLLLALPASAVADSGPVIVDLSYDGYRSGFRVFSMQSEVELTPTGYHIAISGHTTGMVGFFYHAKWQTQADGLWTARGVQSLRFDNRGVFGGQPRHVSLDFVHGDAEVLALQPTSDGEHAPVLPALEHHVIDSLSITALVIHQTAMIGHCQGQAKTFDGRQVEALTLLADGAEDLPPTDRSSWRGATLRCLLDARVLGGFFIDEKTDPTRQDTIWMAGVLPGVPPIPVRMTATLHHLGHTVLYLTSAKLRDAGMLTANRP